MSGNWRSSLAFSTRMTTVTSISTALLAANPSLSAGDARMEATIAETKIYDGAQSAEEYEQMSKAQVISLTQHVLDFPNEEDEDYVPTPGGKTLGRYHNALYHREGLFSVVYKAPAVDDGGYFPSDAKSKVVALKITTPSTMEQPHDSKREAKILVLSSSDNVIPLLDSFREDGSHFILVFPFMRYELGDLLHGKKLTRPQVKSCLKDLFSALSFIHTKGIIHRDIKPSNILLKSLDGPAYLSDFGIAWAPEVAGSEPANLKITDVGTTCYRPPELLFGNTSYDCRLDLWAAGCTVAEALDPDHVTLFDSGELGSDLALIQSIFKKLGTPNLDVWPEAAAFRDWGKVQFYEYSAQKWSALLPKLSEDERDLVENLVRYESGTRMSAAQVLEHSFFTL